MSSALSRRAFVHLTVGGFVAFVRPHVEGWQSMTPAAKSVDHLILGAADLDAAIDWLEKKSGVRASVGGSHPGRGTRNALIALSGRQYLEILAPDPAQEGARSDLARLSEPKMVGWAAATNSIDSVANRLKTAGVSSSGPQPGSRSRPDGRQLKWTTIDAAIALGAEDLDPIPFFIQWDAETVHPSRDSPKGCELTSLEFEHPQADALRRAFGQIGIEAVVRSGAPKIIATLNTPRGRLTLV
jgi:hypothetical protein